MISPYISFCQTSTGICVKICIGESEDHRGQHPISYLIGYSTIDHSADSGGEKEMASLQRSAVSLRRQGSSGLARGEKFFSEELNQAKPRDHQDGEPKKLAVSWGPSQMQQQDCAKEKPRVSMPSPMKHSLSESDMYHFSRKDVRVSIAGLPRSTISFRRQGSSGAVWDDNSFPVELNQEKPKEQQDREERESGGPNQEKSVGQQDGENTESGVPRLQQRKHSQSRRMGYRCCNIEGVIENSVVRVKLCTPRLLLRDQPHRPQTRDPVKVLTKPRKDWDLRRA